MKLSCFLQDPKAGALQGVQRLCRFLGKAQIDGQSFFAYTESETMQRRCGL